MEGMAGTAEAVGPRSVFLKVFIHRLSNITMYCVKLLFIVPDKCNYRQITPLNHLITEIIFYHILGTLFI